MNPVRGWVEADLPCKKVSELSASEDLPRPLARYYLRRDGEDFSSKRDNFSADEQPSFHQPVVGLSEVAQFLASLLRGGETINLATTASATAYFSLSLVGAAIKKLGGSVRCCKHPADFSAPGLIFLDGRAKLEEAAPSLKEGEGFVITPELREERSYQEAQVVHSPGGSTSLPIISYRVCEAVSRKIYGAELPSFVAFDLETSGKSPRTAEIIEIGAVKYRNGCAIEEFETFVSSVDSIPAKISELTGIEDSDLEGAPSPEQALRQFKDFFSDYRLVAHNKGFDIPFLKYHLKKYCEDSLNNPTGDSMRAAQSSFPGLPGYGLSDVAGHLGVELESHHRAMDDARASGEIYKLARCNTPSQVREVLKALAVPASLVLASETDLFSVDERSLFRYGYRLLKEEPEQFPKNLKELVKPGLVRYRGWPLDLLVNIHSNWEEWSNREQIIFMTAGSDKNFLDEFVPDNDKRRYFKQLYEKWIGEPKNVYDVELELSQLSEIFSELPEVTPASPPFTVKLSGVRVINSRLRESAAGKFYQITLADGEEWLTAVYFGEIEEWSNLAVDNAVELVGIPVAGIIEAQQPTLQIIEEV